MTIPEIRRLYFTMKDVCLAAAVTPHVLKTWERKFPQVRPAKNKSGKRLYKPEDIDRIVRIRDWFGEGASDLEILKRLEGEAGRGDGAAPEDRSAEWIGLFRRGLEDVLEDLNGPPR